MNKFPGKQEIESIYHPKNVMQVAFITGLLNIFKELSEWGSTKGKGKNNSVCTQF